jgi:ParB-like chromosome segregation protein Spo0J
MAALRQDGLRPDYESKTTALSIVYRSIGELKLDPRNPRCHSKKQIQQIARSIQTFGFTVPLILDENLRVISGHGRLAAARLLRIDQVPTICVAHLSEAQIRAFQIADNQLTDNSNWDRTLLSKQLQNLTTLKLDFSIESTGFELPQIELLIANTESVRKKLSTKSESFSDSEPAMVVTRPGDLWILGRHRLVCGSMPTTKVLDSHGWSARGSGFYAP